MPINTITEAQRTTLRAAAQAVAVFAQRFAQNGATPSAAATAEFLPLANALTVALAVAGYNGTTGTQFVLNSGTKVSLGTVTGTGNFGTPTIVGGVITGTVLSAS